MSRYRLTEKGRRWRDEAILVTAALVIGVVWAGLLAAWFRIV